MAFNYKKLLPHAAVIAIFLVLTVIVFFPLFTGKVVEQHDIMQWTGMSKEIADFREKTHTEPLWTNSMFGGMPAYQISVMYPANLVSYVNSVLSFGFPPPASYFIIALIGFYLLLISFKIDIRLAVAGAIAFAFSSYNFVIIVAGHNSQAHAVALLPVVIAGIFMTLRGKYLAGGAITAMGLALQLYANHLQITYYLFITIVVLMIVWLIYSISQKTIGNFIKASAVLAVAAAIAILCNITSLWATYEYGKYSTRSQSELTEKKVSTGLDRDYAFQYSYGVYETLTLLMPRFHGGASVSQLGTNSATYKALKENGVPEQSAKGFIQGAPLYWGNLTSTAGPPYAGAIIFFFFVLGCFILKGHQKWWLLSATILSCFLAWGENFSAFNYFMFDHFPAYNKFRAVTMAMTIAQFTIPLMGILALSKLTDGSVAAADAKKYLLYSFYITGGLCLVYVLLPSLAGNFSGSADEQLKQYDWLVAALHVDRETALRTDALRSLFFVALAFGTTWFILKNKIKKQYGFILLSLFVLADLWLVGDRYLSTSNYETETKAKMAFAPSQADFNILQDKDLDYRVFNTTLNAFSDATTSYFHKSIGGYHGAKLKRYQELIENQIGKNNMQVLSMLNTKYFIQKGEDGSPVARVNPGALGNAWFVKNIKVVANADSEMTALTGFTAAETAIVDVRYQSIINGFQPAYDSSASIKLVAYAPNDLKYESRSAAEQLAVFSEIYYDKGWNAYVDGKRSPYFRVNYVLRAMRVPAGEHKIEFKFEPEVYKNGERIALASSGLLILLFAGVVIMEIKKSN